MSSREATASRQHPGRTAVSMVPMKTPKATPRPMPRIPDSTVRTAQLFIKSSCIICERDTPWSRRRAQPQSASTTIRDRTEYLLLCGHLQLLVLLLLLAFTADSTGLLLLVCGLRKGVGKVVAAIAAAHALLRSAFSATSVKEAPRLQLAQPYLPEGAKLCHLENADELCRR